jgi:hypothetical protein
MRDLYNDLTSGSLNLLPPGQGQCATGYAPTQADLAKQRECDAAERTYTFYSMMQQAETMRRQAVLNDQSRLAEIFDEAVEILNVEWNKARKR